MGSKTDAVGLSVEQMGSLARRLDAAAVALERSETAIRQRVEQAWWSGPDAVRFRDLWASVLSPTLRRNGAHFAALAIEIRTQTEQQMAASAAESSARAALISGDNPTNDPASEDNDDIAERIADNRRRIADDLSREEDPDRRALLQSWLTPRFDPVTGRTEQPQILLYDPKQGRVAVLLGDLPNASHVVVTVPGTGTTMNSYGMNASEVKRAEDIYRAMALHGDSAAVIAWLGYDAPSWTPAHSPVDPSMGIAGGKLLKGFIEDLNLNDDQRIGILAHSYGGFVAGRAMVEGLKVDNVLFLASPGAGVDSVGGFHLSAQSDVFAMRLTMDPVGTIDHFGTPPTNPMFGATRLDAEGSGWMTHSGYWSAENVEQISNAMGDHSVRCGSLSPGEYVALATGGLQMDLLRRVFPGSVVDGLLPLESLWSPAVTEVVDGSIKVVGTVADLAISGAVATGHAAVDVAGAVKDGVVHGAVATGHAVVDVATGVADGVVAGAELAGAVAGAVGDFLSSPFD